MYINLHKTWQARREKGGGAHPCVHWNAVGRLFAHSLKLPYALRGYLVLYDLDASRELCEGKKKEGRKKKSRRFMHVYLQKITAEWV